MPIKPSSFNKYTDRRFRLLSCEASEALHYTKRESKFSCLKTCLSLNYREEVDRKVLQRYKSWIRKYVAAKNENSTSVSRQST